MKHAQDEITCFRISETWRKHATPCFRYVYVKVVRFRCIRSNGNARKRHETGNGNTGYPSCFRNGLTCFCHVSVYGFLQFRPVTPPAKENRRTAIVPRRNGKTNQREKGRQDNLFHCLSGIPFPLQNFFLPQTSIMFLTL